MPAVQCSAVQFSRRSDSSLFTLVPKERGGEKKRKGDCILALTLLAFSGSHCVVVVVVVVVVYHPFTYRVPSTE